MTRNIRHFGDPLTARNAAEEMAREAGLSLGEWLGRLIDEDPSDAAGRPARVERGRILDGLTDDLLGGDRPRSLATAVDGIDRVIAPPPWRRLDVNHLARIGGRADQAAHLLSRAFLEAGVRDFNAPPASPKRAAPGSAPTWYAAVTSASDQRLREICAALTYEWTPPEAVEPLLMGAFLLLADLTPARHALVDLCKIDRGRAFRELATLLLVMLEEYRVTSRLIGDVEAYVSQVLADGGRFETIRDDLLDRSGQLLTLSEAAERLGVSRQALHQRVKRGSALGVMRDALLVLPGFQFMEAEAGKLQLVGGLRDVVEPFLKTRAGALSALQFLIEPEPSLGRPPIEALRNGDVRQVVAAAESYLGLREE